MSQAAFLNAIRDDPDDDTPRLVYADWLDEQGGIANAARAEFIRVQVGLARLDETAPARPALEDRENELLRAHEVVWVGDVPRGFGGWRFGCGFVIELTGPSAGFVTPGAADLLQ